MSTVVAFDDIKPEKKLRKAPPGQGLVTMPFFRSTVDTPDTPIAFFARHDPGRMDAAHFHIVDQFQIIVEGKGTFGRHDVSPYCVHFSRAFTPYGPLQMDKEEGLAFIVLRAHYDPGGQHHAEDKLRQVPDRQPWQITRRVTFPTRGPQTSLQPISDIKDEQGLYAFALTMPPLARTRTPDATIGDGQFVVVLEGSLLHNGKEHLAPTIAHVAPTEGSFEIAAGARGLEGLILNLPQVKTRMAPNATPSTAAGHKKWQCELCAFAYDEAVGLPEEGIPAGTRWADVPETWSCPDCAASKSDFQMVEV